MNNDQLTGIIRAILAAGGGLLVQRGYVDNQTMTTIIGALITIGAAAWSVHNNRTGKVIGAPGP
jgi:hypothetical protein